MTIINTLLNLRCALLHLFFFLFSISSFSAFSFQVSDSVQIETKDSIVFHNFDGSNYQASSYNYMSVEDEDGIMYFGNENGLLEFDGTHWELYKTPSFTPIKFLKIIGDKIYTFGTSNSKELGYFQRDENGNMIYHSLEDRLPDDAEFPFIASALEFDGHVYFGSDSTILKWDGEIIKNIKTKTSIAMYEVEGQLLVSLFGKEGGLAKIENDSLRILNKDFNFKNDYAWEILEKDEKEWLIFTSENGVFTMNSETFETAPWDNEVNRYFQKDSLFLYYVEKFRDSLFISSTWQKGMLIFNQNGEIIQELDKESGLLSNYVTHPTAVRRGNLWLTSGYGLQYLHYFNEEEEIAFKPQAKVRYIKLGDSSIYIRDTTHIVSMSERKSNALDFYFSVPGFFKEDLQFSYFLEGFDDDWSEWTNNSRKEYTNLPGGDYTFHLRARHVNRPDLEITPFNFKMEIPKPWYQHSISYVVFVILFGLLIFGFIRYRTHRLSITNKRLEKIVKDRTSELRSQKERLKNANEELKTINNELDNFVYRSSHDLVAPLKSLRGLISVAEMTDNLDEVKEYFKLMNISITKLEEFIKSIMDFSTNTKKPLEMRVVKMDDVIDSIIVDLKFYENAEKVELIRAYDSDFKLKTDPKRLNIILSNLVTNSLKYHDFTRGESPFIKVSAKIENKSYIIEVEDNGSGIPEEYQTKIFDMFFRAHQGIEGSGLGLYIVMDTLNVLKGEIDISSKVRKGTTFKVILPLMD